MKRCPECRRDYYDDSLIYCLEDGTALVQGSVSSPDEPLTAIISDSMLPRPDLSQVDRKSTDDRLADRRDTSIAVLPFANISADPENAYFCDGLAEEILNALARIRGLRVAARTSAFSFQGAKVKIDQIARELGVKYVLEGSVRRAGDQLRVIVRLVDAIEGHDLWGDRYESELRNVFEIQDEITAAVVGALELHLLGAERAIVFKRYTDVPAAFDEYLKGIYFRWKLNPAEFRKCGPHFHRAVEIDPNFALAHFGLASYYGYGTAFGLLEMPPEEGWELAESAIKKVRELDPTLPEVLIENAMRLVHYREWDVAGRAIEEAAASNPSFGEIHHLNSFYQLISNRFDEAISEAKVALTIDPISANYRRFLGTCLSFAGRVEEAIEHLISALDLAPDDPTLRDELAGNYLRNGSMEMAAATIRGSLEIERDAELLELFDAAVAEHGELAAIQALNAARAERVENAIGAGAFVLAIVPARLHLAAGDTEKAIAWLTRAADERNIFPLMFGCDPFYRSLSGDPRFRDLLETIGCPNTAAVS